MKCSTHKSILISPLSGDQGLDFTEVSRIRLGTVCLAPLLLVLDQRGHPVPEGLPQPAPGGRASHPEEAPATGAEATRLPGRPRFRGRQGQ